MPLNKFRHPLRLATWIVASCTLAGLAAQLLGYHSIWGGRDRIFLDYFIPIPVATGTFHIPSLAGFAVAWMILPGMSRNGRWNMRILALAIFLLALATDWDTSDLHDFFFTDRFIDRGLIWRFHVWELHGNPLMLFIMSDALLFFALSFRLPAPESSLLNHTRLRTATVAALVVVAGYLVAQISGLVHPPRPFEIVGYQHPDRKTEEIHLFARNYDGSDEQTRLLNNRLLMYHPRDNVNTDEFRIFVYTSYNAASNYARDRAVLLAVLQKDRPMEMIPIDAPPNDKGK